MRNLLKPLAVAGVTTIFLIARLSPTPANASMGAMRTAHTSADDTATYVIGFDEGLGVAQAMALATDHGQVVDRWIDGINCLVVHADGSAVTGSFEAASQKNLEAIAAEPGVSFVERDAAVSILADPNDPLYDTDQWAPQRIGADAAWDITTGDTDVIVAIVDTGVDANHPDLLGKLVAGTDIYNGDSDPDDDNGHGTQVAGIVGAATNNHVGMAGIGFDTRLMPVKVANQSGSSSYSRISAGIVWAVDNGADVINISMGASVDLANLRNAVGYAEDAGVVVVAASGNHGSDVPFYPAAYDSVIGVGATNNADNRWSNSGYGEWLSVTAPGVDVTTTNWPGNGASAYVSVTGTSYAAPHVAGVAALMYSVDENLVPLEVLQTIGGSAVDLGERGFDVEYGFGRLDADEALALLVAPDSVPDLLVSLDGSGTAGGVAYSGADVLAYDEADGSWSLLFDASDVGIDDADLAAFAVLENGDLLLALDGDVSLDGVSGATAGDILRFSPTHLGDETAGSFDMYFDGSDVGLHKHTSIDAIALDAEANLIMSFSRSNRIGRRAGHEHDLVTFTPTMLGEHTAGEWSLLLDGSALGLRKRGENIDAVWVDPDTADVHLSTDGKFDVGGLQGEDGDVFSCQLDASGDPTECAFADEITWSGMLHDLGSADIDGLNGVPGLAAAPGSPPDSPPPDTPPRNPPPPVQP